MCRPLEAGWRESGSRAFFSFFTSLYFTSLYWVSFLSLFCLFGVRGIWAGLFFLSGHIIYWCGTAHIITLDRTGVCIYAHKAHITSLEPKHPARYHKKTPRPRPRTQQRETLRRQRNRPDDLLVADELESVVDLLPGLADHVEHLVVRRALVDGLHNDGLRLERDGELLDAWGGGGLLSVCGGGGGGGAEEGGGGRGRGLAVELGEDPCYGARAPAAAHGDVEFVFGPGHCVWEGRACVGGWMRGGVKMRWDGMGCDEADER